MKRILLIMLDSNGSKTISYHYLAKIYNLDLMDNKRASVITSGS